MRMMRGKAGSVGRFARARRTARRRKPSRAYNEVTRTSFIQRKREGAPVKAIAASEGAPVNAEMAGA